MTEAVVAQVVEHLAVNEVVPGSSPGDGVGSLETTLGAMSSDDANG